MGGMKEYNKGHESGYTTGPSRMPATFGEWVGYNAGRAQRERETRRNRADGWDAGAGGVGLPGLVVLGVAAAALVGMLVLILGSPVLKVLYPAAGVVGLILTPRVRRALGVATPVYIGALVGLLLGCIDLAVTSPELNFYNLKTFVFVGGMLGGLVVPFSLMRGK